MKPPKVLWASICMESCLQHNVKVAKLKCPKSKTSPKWGPLATWSLLQLWHLLSQIHNFYINPPQKNQKTDMGFVALCPPQKRHWKKHHKFLGFSIFWGSQVLSSGGRRQRLWSVHESMVYGFWASKPKPGWKVVAFYRWLWEIYSDFSRGVYETQTLSHWCWSARYLGI